MSIDSLGFLLSPECLLNFLSNLYPPPVGKKFQLYSVQVTGGSYHQPQPSSQAEKNYSSPQAAFFQNSIFPSRKGGGKYEMLPQLESSIKHIYSEERSVGSTRLLIELVF